MNQNVAQEDFVETNDVSDPDKSSGAVRNTTSKKEGKITKEIEGVTSTIPSATFLSLAFSAMGISALLQLTGKPQTSQFIGQWVPSILVLGLYNKLVKLHGSEQ